MSKKILIVDDDVDFLENMRLVVGSGGFEAVTAENVDQARQALAGQPIDLIILDVMMERDSDGFNFAQELKNDLKYKHIPIIMATSVNRRQEFTFGKETDGDFLPVETFMEKPIRPDSLMSAVKELLRV